MTDFNAAREHVAQVKEEVGRVMVGQDAIVEGVLCGLFTGGHVLLEGLPGLGKTVLVKTLAAATSLDFSRIQFTPDLMPADVLGTTVIDEDDAGRRSFRFEEGPIFSNIVLADEINRATPKTQSAMLEAMQERQVTTSGTTRPLPSPFCVLATQNPLEMEGTFPLPEAQLDRFAMKLLVPYPSLEELQTIMERTTGAEVPEARSRIDGDAVETVRACLREMPVIPPVRDACLRLLLATQPDGDGASEASRAHVRVGASPRGAQSILAGARFRALLSGRDSVSFGDLRSCVIPCLRHRLVLSFEAEAAGKTADDVIEDILETMTDLSAELEEEAVSS
ncbi:MAG: AAA family ATPase [Acidobacteriota bacterium]